MSDNLPALPQRDQIIPPLQALQMLIQTVNQSLDLDRILNCALDKTMELFQCHAAHVRLVNEAADELILAGFRGFTSIDLQIFRKNLKIKDSFIAPLLSSPEIVVFEDIDTDPRYGDRNGIARRLGCRSLVFLPLIGKEKLLGSLAMAYRAPHRYSTDEIQLFTTIGYLIGTAIENAQLHREKLEDAERLSAIFESVDALVYIADMDTGELLFVNQYGKRLWGDIEGKICWQVLQKDQSGPCAFCTNSKLIDAEGNPAGTYIWEFQNTVNQHWYECRDRALRWKDGRLVRLEIATEITERKRVEKALRESEERFTLAFQAAQEGVWDWDMETNQVFYSSCWKRMLGYSEAEVEPHISAWERLLHPDDKAPARQAVEAVMRGERDYEMEFRLRHKDGHYLDILSRGCPLRRDTDGPIVRIVGTHFDLSERKRAEEAIRESEAKFKVMAEQSIVGIAIIQDELLKYVNPKFAQLHGYQVAELVDTPAMKLVFPDDIPIVEQQRIKRRSREDSNFECRKVTRSGKIIDAEIYTAVANYQNKPAAISIVIDVTERKQAEEAVRKSEEFVRNILDTVDEGFIIIDQNFCILTANKAYCGEVAEKRDQIIGRHCYEISHRISRPCYEVGEECPVRRAFDTGEQHSALHRHVDAQGAMTYVEVKAFPIKDGSGTITSVIETINNITERHLLEEEHLKSEKMAAIGTLAGGIAHDFNNLLQGIFGYISMAKNTLEQKERSRTMLEQAEKALHLAVNLTTQLLTFSKGGSPLKKATNLRPVMENAVKFALSGSSVDYLMMFDEGLRMVEADDGQIAQVIQNIVLNADQAMPLGGKILITAKNVEVTQKSLPPLLTAGSYVAIAIQDNGIGIAPKLLPKIFDPYFTTKEKGSGLGLATSYSIIKNHGGIIDVLSEVGKGTTFSVYLPAIEVQEEPAEDGTIFSVIRPGKILVMDDEELIRDIASELIMSLGHEVQVAENGETALEMYRAAMEAGRPYDIVILDLTIRGGMGGMEANERLLAINPDVKTVVSSGYSDNAMLSKYQLHGFQSCLKKPYGLEALKWTLDSLLVK